MKKADLYRLKQGLESVGDLTGIKFAYAVAKNLRRIIAEISILDELRAPSEAFLKYEECRIALARQHSEKDDNGNPRTANGTNGIPIFAIVNMTAFETELEEIRENHKKAIEERVNQIRNYEKFLQEETEIELHLINLDIIPEKISAIQMDAILEIVQEKDI